MTRLLDLESLTRTFSKVINEKDGLMQMDCLLQNLPFSLSFSPRLFFEIGSWKYLDRLPSTPSAVAFFLFTLHLFIVFPEKMLIFKINLL